MAAEKALPGWTRARRADVEAACRAFHHQRPRFPSRRQRRHRDRAPADGTTVDELIANADLALYQAKSDGGNAYRLFLPVLRAQAQARRDLDNELRRAFVANEFELYYQPQIRLADDAVVGAEALLRWRHPVRGILAPGAFIETLADSSIAPEVGRWIIRTACEKSCGMARPRLPRAHRRQPVPGPVARRRAVEGYRRRVARDRPAGRGARARDHRERRAASSSDAAVAAEASGRSASSSPSTISAPATRR